MTQPIPFGFVPIDPRRTQAKPRRTGMSMVIDDGLPLAYVESVLEMSQVLTSVRRSQAIVYWLRLGDPAIAAATHSSVWHGPRFHARQVEELEQAVADSGGRILELARVEDSDAAFREVLRELREQVVLGFYPSNGRGDGKWHDVDVRLPRQGGLTVRTRAGYHDY